MTEKELLEMLKTIKTGEEFNAMQKRLRESDLSWNILQLETKKEYAKTMERIHPCPQEYKDNPHIHYEVARRKREN